LEPLDDVGEGFLPTVQKVLKQGNAAVVESFWRQPDLTFLRLPRMQSAEIGQLEKQTFSRVDKEAFFY
jgi:hypothetical protein